MHVLPRVRELEERFADTLTVIGVHTGKFVAERETKRITEACDRLDVVHAVVNDRQYRTWRDYAVSAWPTLVAIDPEGYIAFVSPGETPVATLAASLHDIILHAEQRGTLKRGPDPLMPDLPRHHGQLRFPTRAILAHGRLWVADTGHGRVLECSWNDAEGSATVLGEHAGFVEPRGLAELAADIYVADRAGHSVWRLGSGESEQVRVAGTGTIGEYAIAAGDATAANLRSPWGLAALGDRLAIAMAGSHQLWQLDVVSNQLALLAGIGAEDIFDGPSLRAALAQPTGLAALGGAELAVADCETSAVRVADAHQVRTLVGTDLFKFGDRAGVGDEALLQHCEDVAVHNGVLAVTDTYNDRLKQLDPVSRECSAWPGDVGEAGALREPGGVWSDGEHLLVADTGNHRVISVSADGGMKEVAFA